MGLWGWQEWKGEEWICRAQRGPLSKPTQANAIAFLQRELLHEHESIPPAEPAKTLTG